LSSSYFSVSAIMFRDRRTVAGWGAIELQASKDWSESYYLSLSSNISGL